MKSVVIIILSMHIFASGMSSRQNLLDLLVEGKNNEILKYSGDVNAIRDAEHMTPLIIAARHGHADTVDVLLQKKAKIDDTDKDGDTALTWAASLGHDQVVRVLLRRGADIEYSNKYGSTALILASRFGHKDTVELLLRKGAKIDAVDTDGDTALTAAASLGHDEIVHLLLEKGADLDKKNYDGMSARDYCAKNGPCVQFLLKQSESLGLNWKVFHPDSLSRPVVILTWLGIQPDLPAIMLNSHMDVVAVEEKYWSHPPFAAEIDDDGRIFARGSQDMKSVGMQYLAAIRALKKDGISLNRTIHVIYTPDEEIGGFRGMAKFVHTNDFKALNVGFCLDEGIASPNDEFPIFYGERYVWAIKFKCVGTTGHASLFHENTAIEKIQFLIEKLENFRKSEKHRLNSNPELTIGDVTTANITTIHGGIQQNVVPPEITMTVDVRMSVSIDHKQFEQDVRDWCKQAGPGIEMEFICKLQRIEPTKLDESNQYWMSFKEVLVDDLKHKIKPQIFPGATDSRHLREANIPVIGFSPMNHTPVLLHENDEFIKVSTYLEGIEIYRKLLLELANL